MKKDVILYIGIDGIKRQIETRIVRKYYRNMIEMYNPKARKVKPWNGNKKPDKEMDCSPKGKGVCTRP